MAVLRTLCQVAAAALLAAELGACAPFEEVSDGCRALRFHDQSLVQIPGSPDFDGLGQLTLEAFVLLDSVSGEIHVVSHHDYENKLGYVISLYDGGEVCFRFYDGQQEYFIYGSAPVDAGRWHHLAASYDGVWVQTFVDGLSSDLTPLDGSLPAPYAGPLRIGSAAYQDGFYTIGLIDEVRLSNVARYTGDFPVPSGPFALDAETVGLWSFDEEGGQVVEDATDAHPGTLGQSEDAQSDDPERVSGTCIADMAVASPGPVY
jgi:hypothetical protein